MNPSSSDSQPANAFAQRRLSRRLAILFGLGAVLAAAYVAASYILGFYVHQQVDLYAQNAHTMAPVQVQVLHHQRGILESSGILQISVVAPSEGGQQAVSPSVVVMEVSYQINHAIWPNRLAHLRWQAKPMQLQRIASSDAMLDQATSLSGQGKLDWQGNYSGHLAMPASVRQIGDQRVALSTMQGDMLWNASQQYVSMLWPLIETHAEPGGVRLSDFRWTIDARNGAALHRVEVEQAYWSADVITGLGLKAETDVSQLWPGRPARSSEATSSVRWKLNADSLSVGKYQTNQVEAQGVLQGFRPDALVNAVSTWLNPLRQLGGAAQSESSRQNIARTLVMDGFDVRVTHFAALTEWAKVLGQGRLVVHPLTQHRTVETTQSVVWDTYVSSNAEVYLQGLSPAMAGLGLLTGILVRAPDGVAMHYALEKGRLTVNGKVAAPVIEKSVLALLNRWMNQLVGGQTTTHSEMPANPTVRAFPVTPH